MTNKKQDQVQDEALLKTQEELREREKETAEKIEVILKENSMALQPFMQFSEYGIAPRVRLVDTKDSNKDGQNNSKGEASEAGKSNGTAEPKQS